MKERESKIVSLIANTLRRAGTSYGRLCAPLRPAAAAAKESAKESAAFAGQSLSPAE